MIYDKLEKKYYKHRRLPLNNQIIFVYLMFDGNLYKIGKSQNPKERLKELKVGNPNLILIAYSTLITEQQLHKYFYTKKIKGEFFNLTEDEKNECLEIFKYGFNKDQYEKEKNIKENDIVYIKKLHKYILTFGKYKYRNLISLTSFAEIEWCAWFVSKYKSNPRKNIHFCDVYVKIIWWLNNFYKYSKIPKNEYIKKCKAYNQLINTQQKLYK